MYFGEDMQLSFLQKLGKNDSTMRALFAYTIKTASQDFLCIEKQFSQYLYSERVTFCGYFCMHEIFMSDSKQ